MRRILAAAEKLFSSQGFDGTTVQQIADEADIAVGTLFLYVSDKSELLLRLFHNAAEVELDQAWDLLRQRRAKEEFGEDPESAQERPSGEVEGYLQ